MSAVAVFQRTGAKVIFAHCQNLGDEEKYLSEDYDLDIVDESMPGCLEGGEDTPACC